MLFNLVKWYVEFVNLYYNEFKIAIMRICHFLIPQYSAKFTVVLADEKL